VGLDVGGDGPEAIALAIVAEASAVVNGRAPGHLRDRPGALHDAAPAAPVCEPVDVPPGLSSRA
jgi:xanthine/CO dehydrogenase XdhC/CoxF family maturation factor